MIDLVLVRHGESLWNKENRFTGWTDVDLSENGILEARAAGKKLLEKGFVFDLAFSSVLKRATKTLDLILEEMGQMGVKVERNWKLNERHYGALQGLNKMEMAQQAGDEQVHIWRRSYDVRPPALEEDDSRCPWNDPLYKDVSRAELPLTECLADTVARVVPYFEKEIAPALLAGRQVIVVAHGNSLRALVKYLDGISDEAIVDLNIPTGAPLVYRLDSELKPVEHYYL